MSGWLPREQILGPEARTRVCVRRVRAKTERESDKRSTERETHRERTCIHPFTHTYISYMHTYRYLRSFLCNTLTSQILQR